jgi:transposase
MRTKVNENLFKDQPFYVGIDNHKKSWKVTILSETYEHKTMSQDPDPEILASYLKRNFPGGNYHAVYEAGFSGFSSCRKLNELGVKCIVVHAADVPTTQKEKEQKTDKADSRKLARSLKSDEFEAIDVPDPKLEADRALVRQRFRVVKDNGRTKHRIKSLLFQFGINIPDHFTKAQTRQLSGVYLKWLMELPIEYGSLKQTLDNYIAISKTQRCDILKLTRQVRELSQTESYRKNYLLLLSIPGIGAIIAMSILVQLGDIKRFPGMNDLCNYVGLVPSMHNSGDKVHTGKMVHRGRKELKIMLIEASWEAIRKDPALMAKFNELAKRMHRNKAIVRIARNLLSRIRYVLVNQQPYELSVVK